MITIAPFRPWISRKPSISGDRTARCQYCGNNWGRVTINVVPSKEQHCGEGISPPKHIKNTFRFVFCADCCEEMADITTQFVYRGYYYDLEVWGFLDK
jgi:hypothetical protein